MKIPNYEPIVYYILHYPDSDKRLVSNDLEYINEQALEHLKEYEGMKILTISKMVDDKEISKLYFTLAH